MLREDFEAAPLDGLLALWVPRMEARDIDEAAWLQTQFRDRTWLAVHLHRGPDDTARLDALRALSQATALPLLKMTGRLGQRAARSS